MAFPSKHSNCGENETLAAATAACDETDKHPQQNFQTSVEHEIGAGYALRNPLLRRYSAASHMLLGRVQERQYQIRVAKA